MKIIFGALLKKMSVLWRLLLNLEYFKPFAFVDDSQRPLLGSDANFHQILCRKFCSGKVPLPESGAGQTSLIQQNKKRPPPPPPPLSMETKYVFIIQRNMYE